MSFCSGLVEVLHFQVKDYETYSIKNQVWFTVRKKCICTKLNPKRRISNLNLFIALFWFEYFSYTEKYFLKKKPQVSLDNVPLFGKSFCFVSFCFSGYPNGLHDKGSRTKVKSTISDWYDLTLNSWQIIDAFLLCFRSYSTSIEKYTYTFYKWITVRFLYFFTLKVFTNKFHL